jgi:NADH-quinone oxidoreductase subunit C
MNAAELAQHLTDATGALERHEIAHDQLSVWVQPARWVEVARHLKDCGLCHFDFFTFLTAVDEEENGFEIVANLYSVRRMHRVLLKTMLPREAPKLATLSGIWTGANWCERETWELFGVDFEGHPNQVKLLLPVEFDGFPLRKDFLLMTREAKEWPGMKEPEEAK